MTDEEFPGPVGGVGEAVVEERRRPSIVWLIPLVALLAGAFVAWRAISERGPTIEIGFQSAEGLEAGKTKVRYKDVEVGLVEEVELAPDLSGIVCRARMVPGAEAYLREKTTFWIVRPRITGGQVTGLGTIVSGAYVGMDPVLEGPRRRSFVGLETAPVVTFRDPGRYFVLRSDRAGAIEPGSPVYFRKIAVGQAVSSELDATDDSVTTRIFVRAPYDTRVHANTRFWNASGIDASIGANGVRIDTQSVVSILVGGIAFDTPEHGEAAPAAPETVFRLYENREEATRPTYTRRVPFLAYFEQSVRGLKVGAPVEFRGIEIGEVTDVRLEFDQARSRFRIPVTIEIEPERLANIRIPAQRDPEQLERLVAAGLRAQLKSGNLLTGQLIVSLDMHANAPPVEVAWEGDVPEIPTIPTPIEEITANLARVVERLGRVPVEEIGGDLRESLSELNDTLRAAERTLASANTMIGPGSEMNTELRRALLELSEAARSLGLAAQQIQTQPSSVIFGRQGSR
jgi:paraquat-inducible protein B